MHRAVKSLRVMLLLLLSNSWSEGKEREVLDDCDVQQLLLIICGSKSIAGHHKYLEGLMPDIRITGESLSFASPWWSDS